MNGNEELTKLVFEQSEYDLLENKMAKKSRPYKVYREAAKWIVEKYQPSFILFTKKVNDEKSNHEFCIKIKNSGFDVASAIKERQNVNAGEDAVFFHPSGCLSLPYKPNNDSKGCIYLGVQSNNKQYTREQLLNLIPVVRILNKSLVFCEADLAVQERNILADAFSHYISPDVVNDILKNPNGIKLGGEKKILTCIFTDLRGFTEISDNMDPIQLVRVLNMYLNEMSQVIIALGGTIDKFEGDAIMAFFGAPNTLKDHAVRCCLAALRMKRMEIVLNEQLLHEKLIEKPLFTRMGINSGDMVVGNIGSIQRIDYTIIGGNVNIASRLETANKDYNTSILISGATYELVKDYFDCERLGVATLKGVSKPIEVYELIKEKENANLVYNNFTNAGIIDDEDIEDAELEDASLEEL